MWCDRAGLGLKDWFGLDTTKSQECVGTMLIVVWLNYVYRDVTEIQLKSDVRHTNESMDSIGYIIRIVWIKLTLLKLYSLVKVLIVLF